MIIKKDLFCIILVGLLTFSSTAHAAGEDTRHFVKTNSAFWKKSFGVRHHFEGGFTSDLTDFQLRLAKVFGIEVEPVKKLNILPALQSFSKGGPAVAAVRKHKSAPKTPSDQVPWGIEAVYNDPTLSSTSGGNSINVAVLDTGVNKSHPDLKNRVKDCKDFSGADPLVENRCDDKNGHGTHVAGIVVADGGSGKGIYGMAPASSLVAYKVCANNGTCFADDVAAAIRLAADNDANIVNLSLGSDRPSVLISDAIAYAVSKEVLVVAAAGNDGPYEGSIDYPAADPNVVSVGAIDDLFVAPDWSARGLNTESEAYVRNDKDIELAAPGVNIESTWKDGDYAILSGTSMAAPHVAGLAAKIWQKEAEHPASATRDLLHSLARDILPLGDDNASGWGLPTL